MPHKSNFAKTLVRWSRAHFLAVIAVIALPVLLAQQFSGTLIKNIKEPFFSAPVTLGNEEIVLATGKLEPIQMVSVGAQVTGQVKDLHVQVGQSVKAGDLIAEIDSV